MTDNNPQGPQHVLLVEDNEDDYILTRERLAEVGPDRYVLEWVSRYEDARDAIKRGRFDVCLLDQFLGDRTGIELLREARELGFHGPIVVLTGREAREIDLEAMRAGAADYLVKDQINAPLLDRAIRYAIERTRTLQALRESEERYALAVEGTNEGLWDWDLRSGTVHYSPRWKQLLGYAPDQVGSRPEDWFDRVHPEDVEGLRGAIDAHLEGTTPYFENEHRMKNRNDEFRWVLSRGVAVRDRDGQAYRMAGSQTDVHDRRLAQQRLRETLGELERSRDDMLSILNRLRVGSALTDDQGRIVFLSDTCRQILGRDAEEAIGTSWERAWPLDADSRGELIAMSERPAGERSRLSLKMEPRGGRTYWVEIEVQDDPRDPRRRIFFLYDVTEVRDLRRLLDERAQYQDLVGKSEPMRRVYRQIQELAEVDSTVLVEGETGTGKELVAQAIHGASGRKKNAFIAVNCAGLTESLLASQLFGHRRGAFTGAIEDHQGVFEAANGGTIFLDEIGDVSMAVQTMLLRVLQEREITRVGESKPRKIDVRVIAATNRDLEKEVEKGTFRLDLLYRIRVVRVQIPPLRERREDIPLLAAAFLRRFRATTGKKVEEISNEAMRILMSQGWRGNVRELMSAIEFAVVRCQGRIIQPADLPPELLQLPERHPLVRGSEEDERQRVVDALALARGNRTAAARLLGISRATFYRRLTELNIDPGDAA